MRSRLAVILMTLGLLLGLTATPVAAAGLTVNTLADTAPADDGSCTLREAITAANTDTASGAMLGECPAGSGPDVISFTAAGSTITLASALPAITSDLTISSASGTTISGASAFQVLTVNPGGALTVINLTITAGSDIVGGGISNIAGTLTVTNSTISGNSATFAGGIENLNGVLTITNSTISGNSAAQEGGGIINQGTMTVTNSTIAGNTAGVGGGGITASGTDTAVNTIIAGNTAPIGPDIDFGIETITTSILGVPVGLTLADILVPAGLANNGGPTQTIALAQVAGNPAIDTGTSAVCAAAPVNGVDQRGMPRPAACDIGAFEIQPPLPDAATAQPGPAGAWIALGFGMLLIGSFGVLAVANLGVVRRRR